MTSSLPKLFALSLALAPLAACTGSHGDKASLPPQGEAPKAASSAEPAAATAPPTAATAAGTAPAAAPTPPDAKAATAQRSTSSVESHLTGEVTAVRKSQIGFRVGGIIQTINTKPGQVAKRGDVLATLDDRDFTIRVEMAKARLDGARVAAEDAQKEFAREQELKKDNASTATTFDKVKAAYDQARIAAKSAELDLQNAELALKDTKLIAPYDCVVAVQMHDQGEQVQTPPPSPVFEIYDTTAPEITLTAPERLMGRVQLGSKLSLTVPAASYTGKAEVVRLVPVISDKTRTFQVIAHFAAYDPKIVAGSYAEATLD